MDTVPFRRCSACHAVIDLGETHWTSSGWPADHPRDYCTRCVGLIPRPMKRSILGQLLEEARQAELKRRARR
jgi:hypothetical protein